MEINRNLAVALLGAFLEEIVKNKKIIEIVEKADCPLDKAILLNEIADSYLDKNWDSFVDIANKVMGNKNINITPQGDC
jgi:hypothetical protein